MPIGTPGAFTLLLRPVPTIAPIALLRPVLTLVPIALPILVPTPRLLLYPWDPLIR